MATTNDIQNFFAKQKAQRAAKPALPPIPATKGTSTADFQKFFTAQQPAGKPLVQRGFEALPGGKFAEQFAGEQKDYWGGQIEHLKKQVEPLIGKPEHRGALQKSWQEFVNTPSVKQAWERINTPLNQNPEEYKRLQAKREWEDHQFAQKHGGLLQAGRGLMESIYDTAVGFTSPVQLLLTVGLEGQGAEAKAALKEAGDFAEAEGGLKAIQSGAAKTDVDALAAAKKARQAGEAVFNENQILATPLKEFTAKKALSSLMSLGFSAQMLSQVKPAFEQAEAQFKAGDITGGIRSGTDALFGVVFGLGGAAHAVGEGFEARGQWKNEAEVKTALQAGAQENYNKPWEKLTPNEKAKVVYEAVNKYGPEESKKFHRTIRDLVEPPALTQSLEGHLNQAILDRDEQNRRNAAGNEAIFSAIAQPAPEQTAEDRAWEESERAHTAWAAERAAAENRRVAGQPLSEFEFAQMQAKPEPLRRMKPPGYDARKEQTAVYLKVPEMRRPGEALAEVRQQKAATLAEAQKREEGERLEPPRRDMALLPPPQGGERTGSARGVVLPFPPQKAMTPQERQEAWYEERKGQALKEMEDERARQAKQAAAGDQQLEPEYWVEEEPGVYRPFEVPQHVERRTVTDYPALEREIRLATPQAPELRSGAEHLYEQQSDDLRRLGAEISPGTKNVEPSMVYERLRRRRFEGEQLSETEDRFISQYARRRQTEKLLVNKGDRAAALKMTEDFTRAQVNRIIGLATRENRIFGAAFDLQKEAMRARSADEADSIGNQAVEALTLAEKLRAKREAEQAVRRAALDPNQFVPRGTEIYVHPGNRTEISLPDKRQIPAMYGAVRLSRLIPSHDPFSFEWNDRYKPHAMQPRNIKTNTEAQNAIIVDSQEGHFDTRRFTTDNPTAEQGPPIILKDGRVAGGNSRLLRLMRALDTNDRQRIIQDLYRDMAKFGVRVNEDFGDTDDPLIPVRVLDDHPEDVAELARYGEDFNRDFIMAFTPEEQSVMAGQRLGLDDIEQISRWIESLPGEGEAQSLTKLLATRGQEVFDLMVRTGVIEENKRAAYLRTDASTQTAQLTEDAKNAFKRMIVGRVIDDADLLAMSKDAVLNKVERALVPLVRIKSANPEWNITDYLKRALQLWVDIERVRDEFDIVGKKSDSMVDKYLHPEEFVDSHGFHGAARMIPIDQPHPIARALAKLLDLSGLKVKDSLFAYADEAEQRQISLTAPMSPVEAFNRHVGEKVDVEVSPLDWGTTTAASDEAKEKFEEQTKNPPQATPEQKAAEEKPREMNPLPAQTHAAEQIASAVQNGTVTPESLHAFFAADPRFAPWADRLMKIFGKVIPNATGMNLADFLRKAVADVRYGRLEEWRRGGMAQSLIGDPEWQARRRQIYDEAEKKYPEMNRVMNDIRAVQQKHDLLGRGAIHEKPDFPAELNALIRQRESLSKKIYAEYKAKVRAERPDWEESQEPLGPPPQPGGVKYEGNQKIEPLPRDVNAKGVAEFLNDARSIITIFEGGDVTTVVHEFFHAMRPHLNAADLKVLEDFAHTELRKQGVAVESGIWTRPKEELLARIWEKYLASGKAPTEEMKGIFDRLRDAFRKIYYIVIGKRAELPKESPINVRLSKDVKATFDRWFGKEPEEAAIAAPPEGKTELAAPPVSIETDISPAERENLKPAFFAPKHYNEVEGAPRVKRADTLGEIRAWAILNKDKLKGMTAWTTPEGKAVAMYVPNEPGTLFQEGLSTQETSQRINDLRQKLAISPFVDAAEKKRIEAEISRLEKALQSKFGGALLFTPPPTPAKVELVRPPQYRPEVKPAEFYPLFPEKVDVERTDNPRTKPDDAVGVQDIGRHGGSVQPARGPARPGENKPSVPGRLSGSGSRRPVRVELDTTPPIDLANATRPYGKPLVDENQWRYRMAELRMPENAPPPTHALDADIAAVLLPASGQQEVAESAYSALQQWDGTVIASPTGTGKTWTALAVSKQMWNDGKRSQLVVTKNREILDAKKKGWKAVGETYFGMKIEDIPRDISQIKPNTIYGTTYSQLQGNAWLAQRAWDMVLLDESAEARRWYESAQGEATRALSNAAKKALYISATPFHNAVEYGYLTKMGLWEPGQFEKWAKQFGAWKNPKTGTWSRHGADPFKLLKLREQMIARGQFITQEKSFEGNTSHFAMVPMTQQNHLDLSNARRAFTEAENYYEMRGELGKARNVRRVAVTWTKNYLERARLPQVIDMMQQARKQGWQVVVFSENNAERNEVYDFMKEADKAMGGRLDSLLPKFPSVYDTLAKTLGKDSVADFSGARSGRRTNEMDDFLSGKKPFMYSSYAAGGVGVSMHDDSEGGIHPRMAIYLGPSYSGIMFEQSQGRLWRFGTNSNVHQIFMTSDAKPEVEMYLGKILPRMRSLKAAVNGVESTPMIERLQSLGENQGLAGAFESGAQISYDPEDFVAVKEQVPISNWIEASKAIPSAQEAKGKGMQYPGRGSQKPVQSGFERLFQEGGEPTLPGRFLSPEEAKARVLNQDLMQALENGDPVPATGSDLLDLNRGTRTILADAIGPTISERAAQRVEADPVGRVRVSAKTSMTEILAAKRAGEVDALPDTGEKNPTWEMRAPKEEKPAEPPTTNSDQVKTNYFLMSGRDNIRSVARQVGAGPVGQQIARNLAVYLASRAGYAGEWTAAYDKILKENRIDKKEHRLMWMVKEGKLPPPNQRIARAVQQTTDLLNSIRQRAAEKELYIKDYNEDGSKVEISYADILDNPQYMPHIHDYKEKIRLKDPATGEEQVFTLGDLLGGKLSEIKKDRILSAIQAATGKSRVEVENFLEKRQRRTPLSGNLERARSADLPFYRMDKGAMVHYFESAGELFARADVFGQERQKLDGMVAQIPNRDARKVINTIADSLLKPRPWNESAGKMYSRLAAAEVITKMAFSSVKVPFHLVHSGLLLEQYRPVIRGLFMTATNFREMKERAVFSGALMEQVRAELMLEQGTDLKLAHEFLNVSGFNSFYAIDRIIANAAGQQWMEKYALPKLMRKAKNSAHIREQLKNKLLLEDAQIDKAIEAGRWTQEDLNRGGVALTNKAMFTNDPTELPPAWRARADDPVSDTVNMALRTATILKSFTFKTANLLKEQLIDEARKGNFRPWIPFLLAYPLAGEAMRFTGAAAQSVAGFSPKPMQAYVNQLDQLFDDPTVAKVAQRWLDDVAHATALTMFSHVMDVLLFPNADKRKARFQAQQLWTDEMEEIAGPIYSDIWHTFEALGNMLGEANIEEGEKKREKVEKAGKVWLREEFPLLRNFIPINAASRYEMAPPPQ